MMKIVAALGALLTCLLLAPPASAAAPDDGQVVYYNLYDGEVKPKLIFTAFSSAPTLKVNRWESWGGRTATGHGTWQSDCASCPPPARRKASIVLSRIQQCEDATSYYSRAIVTVARPDRGETRTRYRLSTGCPPPS